MSHGDPRGGPPRPARAATMLESVEEIRAQVRPARPAATAREARPDTPPAPLPAAPPSQSASPSPTDDGTAIFRPAARPPMAVLRVLDDGDQEGEEVRVRTSPFVIGRADGELVIPHDPGMSARHAELSRAVEDGAFRWILRDLNSTNGTFVRASTSLLKHDQELLLGGLRLRFVVTSADLPGEPTVDLQPATTQKWSVPRRGEPPAAEFVVLTPKGDGLRLPIVGDEAWIGRDRSRCAVVLDDPMVSPRHARVVKDARGRWTIHNERSLNGVWLRVQEIPILRGGQFQCGEQRFLVRVP